MHVSGVQTTQSGFPPESCLHTEVRRFGTQAWGNDSVGWLGIFEMASSNAFHFPLVRNRSS